MSKAHDILGISPNATEEQIKIAYKRLTKKYHPDLNKSPDAKEKFIELNNAYKELTNQEPMNIFDLMIDIIEVFGVWFSFGLMGWFGNKIKLLNKLFFKVLINQKKINVNDITKHFERVLNNQVDIKERIPKPEDYDNDFYIRLSYNIRNQFHPKFISKLPEYWQLFVYDKMRELISRLKRAKRK